MRLAKLLILLLAAFSFSCGAIANRQSASSNSSSTYKESSPGILAEAPISPTGSGQGSGHGNGGGGGGKELTAAPAFQNVSLDQTQTSQIDTAQTDRKIVRNAELNLESDSPETAQQKITAIAESKGGFVVESQQSSSDVKVTTRDVVTMTARVPATKFQETLEEIKKTASRVVVETVKGEDVTEEFIDVEARLKAKRALEQQFVEIMKRANSVDDALSVQRQLAEVRGDIEKIEGRKRFLENQASLSTIKVRLQTPAAFSGNSTGFFYRLTESFHAGFDFALNFILGLVTLIIAVLPFAIFIGLPIYLLIRYLVRRQKRKPTVGEIVEEEIKTS